MDHYAGPEGFQALQCPHCALVAGGGGPFLVGLTCDPAELPTRLGLAWYGTDGDG